jgi:hypothetical protein
MRKTWKPSCTIVEYLHQAGLLIREAEVGFIENERAAEGVERVEGGRYRGDAAATTPTTRRIPSSTKKRRTSDLHFARTFGVELRALK